MEQIPGGGPPIPPVTPPVTRRSPAPEAGGVGPAAPGTPGDASMMAGDASHVADRASKLTGPATGLGPAELAPPPRGAMARVELDRLQARLEHALGDPAGDPAAIQGALRAWLGVSDASRRSLGDDLLELAPPGTPEAARLVMGAGDALGELPADALEQLDEGLPAAARASLLAAYDVARAREEAASVPPPGR